MSSKGFWYYWWQSDWDKRMRALPTGMLHSWCAADFNAAALNHGVKKSTFNKTVRYFKSPVAVASSPLWKHLENDPMKGCEVLRNHCNKDYLSTPPENIPDQNHVEYGDDLDTHTKSFILMQYELKGPCFGWLKTAVCSEVFSSLCFVYLEAQKIFPSSGPWGLIHSPAFCCWIYRPKSAFSNLVVREHVDGNSEKLIKWEAYFKDKGMCTWLNV